MTLEETYPFHAVARVEVVCCLKTKVITDVRLQPKMGSFNNEDDGHSKIPYSTKDVARDGGLPSFI